MISFVVMMKKVNSGMSIHRFQVIVLNKGSIIIFDSNVILLGLSCEIHFSVRDFYSHRLKCSTWWLEMNAKRKINMTMLITRFKTRQTNKKRTQIYIYIYVWNRRREVFFEQISKKRTRSSWEREKKQRERNPRIYFCNFSLGDKSVLNICMTPFKIETTNRC